LLIRFIDALAATDVTEDIDGDVGEWRRMRFQRAVHIILGLGAGLSIGQMIRAADTFVPQAAGVIHYAIAPVLLLGIVFIVMYSLQKKWSRPIQDLTDLLGRHRDGELTLEDLSSATGTAKPIADVIQKLLQDLRRERKKVAELEHEMSERIAHRTEALERMVGSLRQQATRDALTGLYNRRMLDQYLPQLIESCRQDKNDLCVLTIDVDYFKQLNDTLGHAEGDALLRSIGQLIRSTIRQNDAAFRCGGDEFLIVLPATSPEAATTLANRLISLVDGLTQTLKINPKPGLSIGQSRLSEIPEPTPDALLSEADRALYEEKSRRKRIQRAAASAKVLSAP
jgi:diguanylate cyclase (GGDEF)-like protein